MLSPTYGKCYAIFEECYSQFSIDLSDFPSGLPNLLTAPPATAPGFIAVSLAFMTLFVVIFIMISFRAKLGGKLGPMLEKPFINRAVAWLGFFGFIIGTSTCCPIFMVCRRTLTSGITGFTAFLVLRMFFGKAADDFNAGLETLGDASPSLAAVIGNGFTSMYFFIISTNVPN